MISIIVIFIILIIISSSYCNHNNDHPTFITICLQYRQRYHISSCSQNNYHQVIIEVSLYFSPYIIPINIANHLWFMNYLENASFMKNRLLFSLAGIGMWVGRQNIIMKFSQFSLRILKCTGLCAIYGGLGSAKLARCYHTNAGYGRIQPQNIRRFIQSLLMYFTFQSFGTVTWRGIFYHLPLNTVRRLRAVPSALAAALTVIFAVFPHAVCQTFLHLLMTLSHSVANV